MMELEKELKQKMEEITPIDRQVMEAAWKNWDGLCKPLRGLGWLEEALVQIAGIMRDDRPHPDKRAVVIMGADNGVGRRDADRPVCDDAGIGKYGK